MSYELTKWACEVDGIDIYERSVLQQLCKFANEDGICFPSQSTIAEKLNISRVRVNQAIQKLKNLGLISLENGKYYHINHDAPVNVVYTSVNVVNTPPVNEVYTPVNVVNTPVNVVNSHLNKPNNKPINKIKDTKKENRFDEFYQSYPRKVGKPKAQQAYSKAIKQSDHETIMEGLEKQKLQWTKKQTEADFIPHPATWLNGGRWADDFGEAGKNIPADENKSRIAAVLVSKVDQGEIWLERWTQETGLTEQAARQLIATPKLEAVR